MSALPFEAALGANANAASLRLRMQEHHCYRIFLVSDPPSSRVRITVQSEAEVTIASETTQAGIAVLPATTQLCTEKDIDATVAVRLDRDPAEADSQITTHIALSVFGIRQIKRSR